MVRAIVEDDEIGFDVRANHGKRHLGLLGMRERAELLNGILTVESSRNAVQAFLSRFLS